MAGTSTSSSSIPAMAETGGGTERRRGNARSDLADGEDVFPHAPLRVRVCTWNMGGQLVDERDDFGLLLLGEPPPPPSRSHVASSASGGGGSARRGRGRSKGNAEPPEVALPALPDLVVIGVQELVELSVGNIFLATDEEEHNAHALFEERVSQELSKREGQRYVKVSSVGMVGLFLLVYIREGLADQVERVDCDRVKTGVFHFAGNKGAVCTRFDLAGSSFCFLNVHLHAGKENQAARNQDIDDILRFAFQAFGAYGQTRAPKSAFGRESTHTATLHSVAVVLGDFNFRLDLPTEGSQPEGEPMSWLQHDQMRKGLVSGLESFIEGDIEFLPTYKYLLGSEALDLRRLPAWCDRIFFKARYNMKVQLQNYSSMPQLRHTSDHRPVFADLEVEDRQRIINRSSSIADGFRNWVLKKSWSLIGDRDSRCTPVGRMCSTLPEYFFGGCCCRSGDLVLAVHRLTGSGHHHLRSFSSPSISPVRSPAKNAFREPQRSGPAAEVEAAAVRAAHAERSRGAGGTSVAPDGLVIEWL